MGGILAKIEEPEDLIAFRRLSEFDINEDLDIPKSAQNRVPTDRKFLVVFGVAWVVLVPLLIYTLVHADIGRNSRYDFFEITVETHKNWKSVFNHMLVSCCLALGLSLSTLSLFRSMPALVVWGIMVTATILTAIMTILFWYGYARIDNSSSVLPFAISSTILLLILLLVMILLREKIKMIIILAKEAMKIAYDMPQLLVIPVLSFVAELIVLCLFAVTYMYASSAGKPTAVKGYLLYRPDFVMNFTKVIICGMAIWVTQIVNDIQHMVIAGAVTKWYFSKNKNQLDSPILTSTAVTFRFHLSTIVFGSIVIIIMYGIRMLINFVPKFDIIKELVKYCLSSHKHILEILNTNSYVLTAMHGEPFYKSGQRAYQILHQNIINDVVHCPILKFILFIAQLLVTVLTTFLTYLIMKGSNSEFGYLNYIIAILVSFIVAVICFSALLTITDTIFLCFCEDNLLNNGTTKPYAMSRDFMELMENSKKVFRENLTET